MGSLFAILMAIGCSSPPTGPQSTQEDITDNAPTPTEPDTPAQVTDPGQVIDLIVTDSTATAATLAFTQVDDGSGNPADYAVRTHVGPMNWGTAEDVSQGTCAAPLKGTSIGSTLSCTIEGLLPDVGYTFQVVAFRGTFQAGAVYGELSNVVPDMEDEPEPPTNGSYPHEPSTYQMISGRSFDQRGEGEWTDTDSNNYEVGVDDAGAPSALSARVLFPSGMPGGISPVNQATHLSHSGRSELYVHFWVKFDEDWQGHDSGVNKIMYIEDSDSYGAGNPVYIAAFGINSGTLGLQIRLQGAGVEESLSIGSANLKSNVGSGAITRGEWHRVELVLIMNTGTNYDGEAHAWINESKVTEYTDVRFEDDAQSNHRFDGVRWGPVWGGAGDTVHSDMFMWLDDLYVSGSGD